jgi:hypothetical protein
MTDTEGLDYKDVAAIVRGALVIWYWNEYCFFPILIQDLKFYQYDTNHELQSFLKSEHIIQVLRSKK